MNSEQNISRPMTGTRPVPACWHRLRRHSLGAARGTTAELQYHPKSSLAHFSGSTLPWVRPRSVCHRSMRTQEKSHRHDPPRPTGVVGHPWRTEARLPRGCSTWRVSQSGVVSPGLSSWPEMTQEEGFVSIPLEEGNLYVSARVDVQGLLGSNRLRRTVQGRMSGRPVRRSTAGRAIRGPRVRAQLVRNARRRARSQAPPAQRLRRRREAQTPRTEGRSRSPSTLPSSHTVALLPARRGCRGARATPRSPLVVRSTHSAGFFRSKGRRPPAAPGPAAMRSWIARRRRSAFSGSVIRSP